MGGDVPVVAVEGDEDGPAGPESDAPAPGGESEAPDAPDATAADSGPLNEGGDELPAEEAEGPDNEETVDLTEDDMGDGGDLFTDTDDVDDEPANEGGDETADDGDGDGDGGMGELAGGNIATAVNEGAAKLATIGLTDDDMDESKFTREGLETEFCETFEAFQLGHHGSRFMDEYGPGADEDISPAWGLLGSVCVAAAFSVWLRPDGGEVVESVRARAETVVGEIGAGA